MLTPNIATSLIKNEPKSSSHGKPPDATSHIGKANIIETVVMKIAEAIAPLTTAARADQGDAISKIAAITSTTPNR